MDETIGKALFVILLLGLYPIAGWFLISVIRAVFPRHRRSGLRQSGVAALLFVMAIVGVIVTNNHNVAAEMTAAGVTTQEELQKYRALKAKEKSAAEAEAAEAARIESERAAEIKRHADLDAAKKAVTDYIELLRHNQEAIRTTKYSSKEWADASPEVLMVAVSLFQGWAGLYEKGSKFSLSPEQEAIRQSFRQALSSKQREGFPILRDMLGPAMRKKLWVADGKAKTFGPGFKTIELISGSFAAHRNIKKAHETFYPTLMKFRFTRAQYKWVDADVEYTYFTLEPPKDGDIVIWSDNGTFRIQ